MLIKNTVKPVKVTKTNEMVCFNYNRGKIFCDLYRAPSTAKKQIYEHICAEAGQYEHSSIHCVGNCFNFSVYYVYKEHDKYYLRCITPGRVRNIEVIVEEIK
jgi:hypothetical protein